MKESLCASIERILRITIRMDSHKPGSERVVIALLLNIKIFFARAILR
jgi:hypothetical protein